jgi:hypothetical protein
MGFWLLGGLMATLFVRPIELPPWMRLWMFLPLAACIALVYRATRARSPEELPRATALTFLNIVMGMVALAGATYVLHEIVLRFF